MDKDELLREANKRFGTNADSLSEFVKLSGEPPVKKKPAPTVFPDTFEITDVRFPEMSLTLVDDWDFDERFSVLTGTCKMTVKNTGFIPRFAIDVNDVEVGLRGEDEEAGDTVGIILGQDRYIQVLSGQSTETLTFEFEHELAFRPTVLIYGICSASAVHGLWDATFSPPLWQGTESGEGDIPIDEVTCSDEFQ